MCIDKETRLDIIKLNLRLKFSLIAILAFFTTSASFAQEGRNEDQLLYCAQLISLNKKTNEISLKIYDYYNENEKEITLVLSPQVKLENISSLDELKPNDIVTVGYRVKDGKALLNTIYLEKLEENEELPLKPWNMVE